MSLLEEELKRRKNSKWKKLTGKLKSAYNKGKEFQKSYERSQEQRYYTQLEKQKKQLKQLKVQAKILKQKKQIEKYKRKLQGSQGGDYFEYMLGEPPKKGKKRYYY